MGRNITVSKYGLALLMFIRGDSIPIVPGCVV